jgi:SAM-dependent methyltransferase
MYREFAELHEAKHWWFVGRRRIVAALLASLYPGPADRRILDIGCGTGGMIPLLSAFGRVTAVDPAEEAIRYSRERYGGMADLHRVDFPAEPPPGSGYDLVTLFDVLEHLDDDALGLARAASALREGGILLATVPAHRFLWSPHDEINRHRRRYTRDVLATRVRASGLVLRRISYFNAWLFLPICCARFARRGAVRRGEERSDFRVVTPVLNRALAALFGSERHLLRRLDLPFGVSLLVVAEKAGAAEPSGLDRPGGDG